MSDKLDRHRKKGTILEGRVTTTINAVGMWPWEMAGFQYVADLKGDCHRSDTCADYFDFDERSAIGNQAGTIAGSFPAGRLFPKAVPIQIRRPQPVQLCFSGKGWITPFLTA